MFAGINWFGVLAASLAYYALGAAWFTPLFGKTWDRSIGYTRTRDSTFSLGYYLVPLASATVVTIGLAIVLASIGPSHLGEASLIGVVLGAGVAAVSANNALTPHTKHPYLLGAVTGGYHLVGMVVAATIIGAFTV